MRSDEAMKAAIQKLGPKAVADRLKVSASLLYKWMEPESGAQSPLDRIAEICRVTGDATPVRWLCSQVGGFFVENAAVEVTAKPDVLKETQRILREFSDVLSAVSQGHMDGVLSTDEAQRIRGEWDELKSIGEAFVGSCEASVPPSTTSSARARRKG